MTVLGANGINDVSFFLIREFLSLCIAKDDQKGRSLLLFSDLLCLCSATALEYEIPLIHAWVIADPDLPGVTSKLSFQSISLKILFPCSGTYKTEQKRKVYLVS